MIINCNSILASDRAAYFKLLTSRHNPDVILGCESKIDDGVTTSQAFPENYKTYRGDRKVGGGGVFVCIKDDLVCDEAPTFHTDCELVWATLQFTNSKTLYIGSFYRPPSSKKEVIDNLALSVGNIFAKHKNRRPHIILGGDFNLGDIDWKLDPPCLTNPQTKAEHEHLLDFLADFGLTQHITEPTRPASGKTLDLAITSNPCTFIKSTIASGMSDHSLVLFDVNARPTRVKKPPHKIFLYNKADPEGMKVDLKRHTPTTSRTATI
jgi:exonuclease III